MPRRAHVERGGNCPGLSASGTLGKVFPGVQEKQHLTSMLPDHKGGIPELWGSLECVYQAELRKSDERKNKLSKMQGMRIPCICHFGVASAHFL